MEAYLPVIWAILIAAAGLLSPAAIIASVVITECMVLAIVGRHLFRARR